MHHMRLHREGTPTLLLTLAFTCLASYAALQWLPMFAALPVVLITIAVMAIVLWFFRVPHRTITADPRAILSPCDGKVVVIEAVEEPEYFKAKRRQVSIFMSPVNVHVNWNPIAGVVAYTRYHPGKYLVAWHPKSSTENERSTIVLKNQRMEVLVRQIAGALARRIVTYSKNGANADQGTELGFIKFGSRVDLFLPLDATVQVKLGDRVTGSQSVIATVKP